MAAWNIPAPKSKYISNFLGKIIGISPLLKMVFGVLGIGYMREAKTLKCQYSCGFWRFRWGLVDVANL